MALEDLYLVVALGLVVGLSTLLAINTIGTVSVVFSWVAYLGVFAMIVVIVLSVVIG